MTDPQEEAPLPLTVVQRSVLFGIAHECVEAFEATRQRFPQANLLESEIRLGQRCRDLLRYEVTCQALEARLSVSPGRTPETQQRIAEIRERVEKATPEPWAWAQTAEKGYGANVGAECFAEDDDEGERPLSGDLSERTDNYHVLVPVAECGEQSAAPNADLIANAPADLRFLLDLVSLPSSSPGSGASRSAQLKTPLVLRETPPMDRESSDFEYPWRFWILWALLAAAAIGQTLRHQRTCDAIALLTTSPSDSLRVQQVCR